VKATKGQCIGNHCFRSIGTFWQILNQSNDPLNPLKVHEKSINPPFLMAFESMKPSEKNPPAEKAERGDIIGCSFSHRPQGVILRRGDVPFTTNDLIKGDLEVLPK
jgi:hypothetical protein